MENYYEEIIREIRSCIEKKEYDEALSLLKKELSMPYIPQDIESQLNDLMREVRFEISDKKQNTESSLDTLLDQLHGDAQMQLSAAAQLSKRNLRECVEDIQNYLQSDPFEEAAALLIESIAEQEIQEEFIWVRNGVEYAFYGDSLIPCAQSKGFLKANAYLKEWFDKYLDMYEMAKTLLIHEVYMFLPLSYEEEEGMSLAFEIFENVCEMMGQDELLCEVKEKIGLNSMN